MSDKTQLKDVVRSHFTTDEAVQLWEKLYRDSENFFAYCMSARKAAVLERLGRLDPAAGPLLADIGCGSGLVSKDLLAMGYDVTGMDISEGMLENARKIPGLKLQVGDIENLPFANGAFDKVICLGVISYVPNEAKALAELHRVLKPGGLLLIAVRNKLEISVVLDPIERLVSLCTKLSRRVSSSKQTATAGPYYHRNFIPWTLKKNLRQAGFTIGECLGRGYDYPVVNGRRITSVQAGIRFSRRIEKLSARTPFGFLRNWGMVYIVAASKPAP